MSEDRGGSGGESKGTVLLAGAANLAIAIAKIIGGLITGSSAMLSEGAHSVADTMNQVFLLTALRRSSRQADVEHPFGYGKERYFWSLLAAVGIFVLGAGFSILQGVEAILTPEPPGSYLINYLVLAVSFLFEGVSWLKAVRQLRGEARAADHGLVQQVRESADPTVTTVALEDSAALVGLVLAAAGIGLHQLTGDGVWDGAASIAIGLLLVVVAGTLGHSTKDLLIGQAVPLRLQREIRDELLSDPAVHAVVELLTMQLGPGDVLVAAKVDVENSITGGDVEQVATRIDERLTERFPEVTHVFLDPTDVPEDARTNGLTRNVGIPRSGSLPPPTGLPPTTD